MISLPDREMALYQQSVCVVRCGVVCGGHAALALQAARCCTHLTALHCSCSVQCLQSAASHHHPALHSPARTTLQYCIVIYVANTGIHIFKVMDS